MMQAQLDQGTKLPLLTKTKDGTAVPSPYLGIMTRAAAIMIKAASELGFSPASRPRLATGQAEDTREDTRKTRARTRLGPSCCAPSLPAWSRQRTSHVSWRHAGALHGSNLVVITRQMCPA
jgi:hypothetical protein